MNAMRKVVAIERIAVEDITSFDRIAADKIRFTTGKPLEKLNIKVPGDFNITSKTENNVRMYAAKLVFQVFNDCFHTGNYIYLVHLADGRKFVLGSNEKPYPNEQTTLKFSSEHDSADLIEVTVSYKNHLAIATAM